MYRGIIFGIVFSLAALCSAHSATIYLPDNYLIFQNTIHAYSNRGTIIVEPGTYVGNSAFGENVITRKSHQTTNSMSY